MIPGTQQIVAGLIDNELCMDLVNLAGNTGGQALMPIPQPVSVNDNGNGGYITYRYSLSTGDESGNPACGTVTVRESLQNQQTVAGVSIDMAAVQQAILNNVLTGTIRPQVLTVAQNLWQNKTAASLAPLQGIYASAVSTYTSGLTSAAQATAQQLNAAVQANATQARNGSSDLLQNEVQQSTLGWTAAGAYYLEIAKLNAATLSLLNATPITTSPTYDGIPTGLSYDLAPLESAAKQFMTTLSYVVQSSDPTQTPNGVPQTLTDAKNDAAGADVLSQVFGQMNLTNAVLQKITGFILPQTQIWTDPFGGLMSMGQLLINTSLIAMGAAAILSSATASTGTAIWRRPDVQLGRRRSDRGRARADELSGNADLRRTPGHPGTGDHHRLHPADDPLRHVDGRRRRLDHPRLRGDDRGAALDAGAHDRRRRRAAWAGDRGLGPPVSTSFFAPTLMVIGLFLGYFVFDLYELADSREFRHQRPALCWPMGGWSAISSVSACCCRFS